PSLVLICEARRAAKTDCGCSKLKSRSDATAAKFVVDGNPRNTVTELVGDVDWTDGPTLREELHEQVFGPRRPPTPNRRLDAAAAGPASAEAGICSAQRSDGCRRCVDSKRPATRNVDEYAINGISDPGAPCAEPEKAIGDRRPKPRRRGVLARPVDISLKTPNDAPSLPVGAELTAGKSSV